MVLESPELSDSPQGSSGMILCELAGEAKREQLGGWPGTTAVTSPRVRGDRALAGQAAGSTEAAGFLFASKHQK